jgi:hypothetical protein
MDWPRNQKYEFFEYACHEGDEQVRNYIIANRTLRSKIASGEITKEEAEGRRPRRAAPAAEGQQPAAQPRAENAQPRQQ